MGTTKYSKKSSTIWDPMHVKGIVDRCCICEEEEEEEETTP
jgi:hypothetical protein